MIRALVRTTLWDGFPADDGERLAEVTWLKDSLTTTWRDTGEHDLRGRIAVGTEAATALLGGDLLVLQLEREGGGVDEWLVTEVHDARRGAAIEVQATSARGYLGTLDPVVQRYPGGTPPVMRWSRAMPAVQFWLYELQYVVPAWITKGVWDDETINVVVTCDRTNPLEFALQIAEQLATATGVRRRVALRWIDAETYALDIRRIVADPGTTEVRLEEGRNLTGLKRSRRRAAKPTILLPGGNGGVVASDGYWRISAGSGTAWTLAGWDGMPDPVPFDDIWNGTYLRAHDGTLVQITDCTAPNSIVVSSGTALAIGHLVQLPLTVDGVDATILRDPLRTVDLAGRRDYPVGARTNFLRTGHLAEWSGGNPVGWTVTTQGGVSYAEETNTIAWEYGGAAVFWQFDGVTGGQPILTLQQTFAMPHRLRNRYWYALATAWASGAAGCTMAVDLYRHGGVTTAFGEIAGRSGIDDWATVAASSDQTAAGVGAWTGGVRIRIYQAAATPARNGYLDLVLCGLDEDPTPVFGSQPGTMLTPAIAELLAGRSAVRYQAEVVDRARAQPARFAHEALSPAGVARIVAPSMATDVRVTIAEMTVSELQRTATRLALAEAPARLSGR
jgi:hypothetical protein